MAIDTTKSRVNCWALGIGHWALGIGHWALGIEINSPHTPFLCPAQTSHNEGIKLSITAVF